MSVVADSTLVYRTPDVKKLVRCKEKIGSLCCYMSRLETIVSCAGAQEMSLGISRRGRQILQVFKNSANVQLLLISLLLPLPLSIDF